MRGPALDLGKRDGQGRRSRDHRNVRLTQLLIVLVWLRVIVPSAIIVLDFGRLALENPAAGSATSPLADRAGTLLSATICSVALLLIVRNFKAAPARHIGWLFAFLAPAVALFASDLVNGTSPGALTLAAYPLVGLAVWLASPPITVLATSGYVTVVVAAGSLIWGLVAPGLAALPTVAGSKALFQGLLAGPFIHSNLFGMALVLGLPFVLMIDRAWFRRIGVVAVVAALVWSAARTSQGAAAALLLVHLMMRRAPRSLPIAAKATLALGAALVVFVPLATSDPDAFTQRGRIWMRGFSYWQEQPVLGWGSTFFSRLMRQVNDVGRWAFHGHNLFVNTLVVGGLLTVVAVAALLALAAIRAARLATSDHPGAFVFLVAALFISCLEGAYRIPNIDGALLWAPLAIILFARSAVPSRPTAPFKPAAAVARRAGS